MSKNKKDRPAPGRTRHSGADRQAGSDRPAGRSGGRSDDRSGSPRGPRPEPRPEPAKRPDATAHSPRPPRGGQGLTPLKKDGFFLFGRHAVEAALRNPARECVRLVGLQKSIEASGLAAIRPDIRVDLVADEDILRSAVPSDSPHQGILLEVRALPGLGLEDLTPLAGRKNIILMLDQVTDPHNVGACLRSAAAFGARALITQDRNSPHESGVLARASSGGLELTPWIRVINLSQALESLKDMGYWHVGLDGDTDLTLKDVSLGDNIVIVMGSEGSGMRQLTRRHCDTIARIPMSGAVESLNVSVAAAIALYELGAS